MKDSVELRVQERNKEEEDIERKSNKEEKNKKKERKKSGRILITPSSSSGRSETEKYRNLPESVPMETCEEIVMRPPLMGIAQPIPEAPGAWLNWSEETAALPQRPSRPPGGTLLKSGVRVIQDVQVVPSRQEVQAVTWRDMPSTSRGYVTTGQQTQTTEKDWTIVSNSRNKNRKQPTYAEAATSSSSFAKSPTSETKPPVAKKPKARNRSCSNSKNRGANADRRAPPKSAAMTIKDIAEDYPYAEILKKMRENISLSDLGIENSRMRKTANGGYLIEIPGEDNADKAEALAKKIKELLQEEAVVSRPVIKAGLKVIGFDDSVSADEVCYALAESGGCTVNDIKLGAVSHMKNGLCIVWAQCPLTAATRLASLGKLRVGWTYARIEILKQRPQQCYKCLRYGHIRNNCKANVDFAYLCFKCGHPAKHCQNKILRCVVCEHAGGKSDHRLGSNACLLQQGLPPNSVGESTNILEAHSDRRTEEDTVMEHD